MSADAEGGAVLEIFVAEAEEHVATLRGEWADRDQKRAAATALREAAALVGEHAIARAAAQILEWGVTPEAIAELGALLAERRASLADGPSGGDDAGALRSSFCEEADEALERTARTLVGLGDRPPGEAVLGELLRTTHALKGSAATVGLDALGEAVHALEDTFDALLTGARLWWPGLGDRLALAVDALRAAAAHERATPRAELDRFYDHLARLDEPSGERAGDGATAGRDAVEEREGASAPPVASPRARGGSVLRIDSRRIDALMDSVGELVFDRTRITRRATEIQGLAAELERARCRLAESPASEKGAEPGADLDEAIAALRQTASALVEDADALRRTGKSLQDGLTRVRMLTASSLFRQLAPQVRAMGRAAGKRVTLETSGGETEFDKAVATQITDSLLQLLRNAIAHGIEAPETRRARGKPAEGNVSMTARHEGSAVVLEVSDDGAGIDPSALRSQFVEAGRWSAARAQLATDRDVIDALFESGTSQRGEADRLAGRGVGLASVRESIARLGGEIETRSTPGEGTRFRVRLPVTAAVTQALLFKIGGEVFALPQSYVLETAHVDAASVPRHLHARSRALPLVPMHGVLGVPVPEGARSLPAVVLTFAGKELAITCDRIVGPREIVIKQLGPILSTLPLYAGGTISGSGKVQLILDPAELVRLAFADDAFAAAAAPAPGAAPYYR